MFFVQINDKRKQEEKKRLRGGFVGL